MRRCTPHHICTSQLHTTFHTLTSVDGFDVRRFDVQVKYDSSATEVDLLQPAFTRRREVCVASSHGWLCQCCAWRGRLVCVPKVLYC